MDIRCSSITLNLRKTESKFEDSEEDAKCK
jgi:hypothetical protein